MKDQLPVAAFNELVAQVLQRVADCRTPAGRIDDEDVLLELHELFPGEALAALDLCDRAGVSALVSPSGRRIYRCRAGPSATPYLVSNTGYVCTCAAYKFAPMGQRQRIGGAFCKHLLAVQLSLASASVRHEAVSEDLLCQLLSELVRIDSF